VGGIWGGGERFVHLSSVSRPGGASSVQDSRYSTVRVRRAVLVARNEEPPSRPPPPITSRRRDSPPPPRSTIRRLREKERGNAGKTTRAWGLTTPDLVMYSTVLYSTVLYSTVLYRLCRRRRCYQIRLRRRGIRRQGSRTSNPSQAKVADPLQYSAVQCTYGVQDCSVQDCTVLWLWFLDVTVSEQDKSTASRLI
jgi:hypothetical protein